MKHIKIALVTSLALASTLVQGQSEEPLEIIVTAKRFESSIKNTPHAVSFITKEDIESSQYKSISEAIGALPGVYVARSGTLGGNTTTFIRGSESNHTLILLDGVRVTTESDGTAALGQIPLTSVERIEVIRGGASIIYGADAVGGVINIITNRVMDTPQTTVTTKFGAFESYLTSISHQQVIKNTRIAIDLEHQATRGFDAKTSLNTPEDDDGYDLTGFQISLDRRFNDIDLMLKAGNWAGDSNYDDGWSGDTRRLDSNFLTVGAGVNRGRHSLKTTASTRHNYATDYYAGTPKALGSKSKVNQESLNLSLQSVFSPNYTHTVGVDYAHENTGDDKHESNGLYWLGEFFIDEQTFQLGARNDSGSHYGNNNTWSLGYINRTSQTSEIYANYRTSFSAPTFLDTNAQFYSSVPDLSPEIAKSAEIGTRLKLDTQTALELALFQTHFTDKIQYDFASGTMSNISTAQANGFEVTMNRVSGNFELDISYTYTDSQDDKGALLFKRPIDQASLKLKYSLGDDADIQLSSDYIGGLMTSGAKSTDEYTLWSSAYNRKINEELNFGIRIDNLLDEKYSPLFGYNARPRYIEATLRYTF